MNGWEPRLASGSGVMRDGWMHREAVVPLLSNFKIYGNKTGEKFSDFSSRFKPILQLLGGRFSMILFDSRSEFKRGLGTHSRNNFLGTRPGIYSFYFESDGNPRAYVGQGKDLHVRLSKHYTDWKIQSNSIGFCLISTDGSLTRGTDPFLSEGLRGTLETSLKWMLHAWKNYRFGPHYDSGVAQIISHVTKSNTPRSDGHYIISKAEADMVIDILVELHNIFRNLPSTSILYNMLGLKLGLDHTKIPDLSEILCAF